MLVKAEEHPELVADIEGAAEGLRRIDLAVSR